MKAKVIGAGSIGNHLTQACRRMGWEVAVVDADPSALVRMREQIYPKRYGAWDETILQFAPSDAPKGGFDIVFVGTPPNAHLSIATQILRDEAPRVLQIEKPLCSPTFEGLPEFLAEVRRHPETKIIVGYNHLISEQTEKLEELVRSGVLGQPLSLNCEFRSHWKNIFSAHPWLSGPQDTYLGFWKRGGGAGGEHSHGISLLQHALHLVGAGRVTTVGALIEYAKDGGADFDRHWFVQLTTEKGIVARCAQDVVTQPKKKFLEIQGANASILWDNDVSKILDQVTVLPVDGEKKTTDITKERKDELFREIQHVAKLIDGSLAYSDSPMRLQRGLDTMAVLAASHRAQAEGRVIDVDYAAVTI